MCEEEISVVIIQLVLFAFNHFEHCQITVDVCLVELRIEWGGYGGNSLPLTVYCTCLFYLSLLEKMQ